MIAIIAAVLALLLSGWLLFRSPPSSGDDSLASDTQYGSKNWSGQYRRGRIWRWILKR
jgi:hypothetical protein